MVMLIISINSLVLQMVDFIVDILAFIMAVNTHPHRTDRGGNRVGDRC
ncbi:MAG: hypothetical protein ACFWUK_10390 [Serratia liquefaciens]